MRAAIVTSIIRESCVAMLCTHQAFFIIKGGHATKVEHASGIFHIQRSWRFPKAAKRSTRKAFWLALRCTNGSGQGSVRGHARVRLSDHHFKRFLRVCGRVWAFAGGMRRARFSSSRAGKAALQPSNSWRQTAGVKQQASSTRRRAKRFRGVLRRMADTCVVRGARCGHVRRVGRHALGQPALLWTCAFTV